MIKTKSDLDYYLEEDRKAYGKPKGGGFRNWLANKVFRDCNYEYVRCIRYIEFYQNRKGFFTKLRLLALNKRKARLRAATGIDLEPGCAGPGIHIAHGKCVIHVGARIGCSCKILSDVTIGIHGRKDVIGSPIIGDRVFIGSGARIIGPVHIANDVVIGANAVVVGDILEDGVTVAGNPAEIISHRGSQDYYLCVVK